MKVSKYFVIFMLLAAALFILAGCSGTEKAVEGNGEVALEGDGENGDVADENEGEPAFVVEGRVGNELEFQWGDFSDKEVTIEAAMKKCLGTDPPREFTGIPLHVILEAAELEADTTKLTVQADDGYEKNFILEDVLADDEIIIAKRDGKLQIIAADEKYDASYWVSGVIKLIVN